MDWSYTLPSYDKDGGEKDITFGVSPCTAGGSSSYCTSAQVITPRPGRTISRRNAPSRSSRDTPKVM